MLRRRLLLCRLLLCRLLLDWVFADADHLRVACSWGIAGRGLGSLDPCLLLGDFQIRLLLLLAVDHGQSLILLLLESLERIGLGHRLFLGLLRGFDRNPARSRITTAFSGTWLVERAAIAWHALVHGRHWPLFLAFSFILFRGGLIAVLIVAASVACLRPGVDHFDLFDAPADQAIVRVLIWASSGQKTGISNGSLRKESKLWVCGSRIKGQERLT